ncbi:hypothetical protein HYU50_05000 [Candidatus Woesearchaeota archaeon]|nr:hypothetical protein [Candidatus Woesearchaeota archaeon]
MGKKCNNPTSQAFSMDIMLAVIIFIGTVFFFYVILSTTQGNKADELHNEALKVLTDILSEDSGVGITDGNKINITKLGELLGNYSGIKGKLKVKNDFCIYFEDENGNIIYINMTNMTSTGVGSGIINVSNVPCG